ncbi:MAG TPA: NUDIX domain-containing protein [Streptosporangiaceae bacterium]
MGAIITDAEGRLLLIKRGHPPQAGRWSLPGGRIEPGESDEQALVREVLEETGLRVSPGRLVGSVERPGSGDAVLDIRDYAASVTGGELLPGDDADDARWVGPPDLGGLPLTSGLAEALAGWGVLGSSLPSAAGNTAPSLARDPAPSLARDAAPSLVADTPPSAAGDTASALAFIAEATKRAGLLWLTIPGREQPRPAWHVWRAEGLPPPGAAYVVTGPGEQPLPGLGEASRVTVTVASSQTGGRLVSWTAVVSHVEPGSADWNAVIGQLASRRLNAALAPWEDSPAQRWARSGAVFRLSPVAR